MQINAHTLQHNNDPNVCSALKHCIQNDTDVLKALHGGIIMYSLFIIFYRFAGDFENDPYLSRAMRFNSRSQQTPSPFYMFAYIYFV